MNYIIYLLFGLLLGYLIGYIHKTLRVATTKHEDTIETVFESLDTAIDDFTPSPKKESGSFIEVNKVETFLKENKGVEVRLGDIIDET